ncbi:ABC transporter ATP-binding protein [Sphingobacterium sp. DN00404]|uniref:ABC transporter ATP-binding protein n=1 Tax=Sphingobacterium micropteri TaxID=2763501 RepID=A0ABR7YLP5_9SPHI|nr:ABC transporter ATP-binding protein [Sphingobacterium micropteri]
MDTGLTYQLKWTWKLTKGHRVSLLSYFVLECIAIVLSLVFVLWSKRAIDIAVEDTRDALQYALVISIVAITAGLLLRTYAGWINERTRMRLLQQLQNSVIAAQMLSTWEYVKRWHTGDIQVRIHNDCREIVQMIGLTALSSLLTFIRLLASFGFLWMMDPMLALLIIAVTPLFLFSKLYFKRLRRMNRELKTAESNLGNIVQENLRLRMVIRALGLQENRWNKVVGSQETIFYLKNKLLNFSTASRGIMKLTVNIGFLLTFVWGIYRLHNGEISFGTMTAFLQLVGRIQSPMLSLLGFVPAFIPFRTALERVQATLSVTQEKLLEAEHIEFPQAIQFEQVYFRYEDAPVIERINAELQKGKPTAIVGSSGKGKTTLVRLVLGLIQPNAGDIWIQTGGERRRLSGKHRGNIAYVPQGDKLFSGTIRENLIPDGKLTRESRLDEALYLACAEFIYDLPQGIDTVIGESGYGLSEGQAQRIAIARACMRDCPIWLFDEITSALDTDTAMLLMQRLIAAGKDKIVVFVTHDLKLAEACDQTIYI